MFDESLIVHEVLHAATPGSGPVEHGLVDAMEALYVGPDSDSNWTYGDIKDFSDPQQINGRDTHSVVGNAVYRIYKKSRNQDRVFEFAMELGKSRPRNLRGFRRDIVSVVATFPSAFQRAVAEVLVDMGINDLPSNAVPISILRFLEAKLRELAANASPQDPIQAAWEEAMKRLREELGLDDDEVLRSSPAKKPKPPKRR